jgi:hypothetical protein
MVVDVSRFVKRVRVVREPVLSDLQFGEGAGKRSQPKHKILVKK